MNWFFSGNFTCITYFDDVIFFKRSIRFSSMHSTSNREVQIIIMFNYFPIIVLHLIRDKILWYAYISFLLYSFVYRYDIQNPVKQLSFTTWRRFFLPRLGWCWPLKPEAATLHIDCSVVIIQRPSGWTTNLRSKRSKVFILCQRNTHLLTKPFELQIWCFEIHGTETCFIPYTYYVDNTSSVLR